MKPLHVHIFSSEAHDVQDFWDLLGQDPSSHRGRLTDQLWVAYSSFVSTSAAARESLLYALTVLSSPLLAPAPLFSIYSHRPPNTPDRFLSSPGATSQPQPPLSTPTTHSPTSLASSAPAAQDNSRRNARKDTAGTDSASTPLSCNRQDSNMHFGRRPRPAHVLAGQGRDR